MAILYGFHAVSARVKTAPASVEEVLVDQHRKDKRMQQFIDKVKAAGVKVSAADSDRLEKAAGHKQHQGVVAFAKELVKSNDLFEIIDTHGKNTLLLVLDGVTDPHNLGACLRSADAAGVDAVIVPRRNAAGLTPVACRTAVGAAESLAYYEVGNLANLLDQLRERGVWVVGTALEERSESLFAFQAPDALAVVMGAEGAGLKRLTRDKCDQLLEIPMAGEVQSLNVSVATGVMLFHVRAQRESSE